MDYRRLLSGDGLSKGEDFIDSRMTMNGIDVSVRDLVNDTHRQIVCINNQSAGGYNFRYLKEGLVADPLF